MATVNVIVTSTPVSRWTLRPYNPQQKVICAPNFWVPTYKVTVQGVKGDFQVIRFGIQRKKRVPIPEKWSCDCGLTVERTYDAVWVPDYRPVSFEGSIPGGWLLKREGSFLIHEGTPFSDMPLGTYGCVEVLGAKGKASEWFRFLNGIAQVSGVTYSNFQKVGMRVTIKKAAYPVAVSQVVDASVRKALGQVLADGPYGEFEISHKGIETVIRSTYSEKAESQRVVSQQELDDLNAIRYGYVIEPSGVKLLDKFIADPKKRI